MADQAYALLTSAQRAFKDFVWDPFVAVIRTGLETLPYVGAFFKLPVVNQLKNYFVDSISAKLFDLFRMFVDVGAIRFVNPIHQNAYENASLKMKLIERSHGLGSQEYLEARNAGKAAMSTFTQFGR